MDDRRRLGRALVKHFMNRFRGDAKFRRDIVKLSKELEAGRGPVEIRMLVSTLQAKKATKH